MRHIPLPPGQLRMLCAKSLCENINDSNVVEIMKATVDFFEDPDESEEELIGMWEYKPLLKVFDYLMAQWARKNDIKGLEDFFEKHPDVHRNFLDTWKFRW